MNFGGISVFYIIHISYIFLQGASLAQRKTRLNLCEENPGFHPNGDYLPRPGNNLSVYVNKTSPSFKCLMKFTTCSSCRFIVNSMSNFTFPECHKRIGSKLTDCIPRCTYLLMFDVDYKNETATLYHQGPFERFIGESHVLYVMVCADNSRGNIQLQLGLTVEKKIQKIRGSSYDDSDYNRYVLTPFFPNHYAENDEEYVYKFEAVNNDEYIQLIFDDWHLSPISSLAFENSDIQGPIYGSSYRPTVISNGHYLNMIFKTGKKRSNSYRNYMGFKVSYEFHRNQDYVQRYRTNCGGYLLNLDGGTIMFDGEIATDNYYDCIWVVKKQPGYDSLFIKVENFSPSYYIGQRNSLQIRDGLTSLGGLRETLTSEESSSIYGHVSSHGFYIRLKGRYREKKDFILTYASYKHGECKTEKYFKCDNRKCINSSLKCDGFNHCGDGSDEKTSHCGGNGSYSSSPYSYSLSVGVIIPIVISVFLIVVICLLIIFIRRCRKLSSLPLDDRQRIHTVNGQQSHRRRNRQRISMNVTISQDAPPTYEEVVRSTPIGHLNMAFMWSQSELGMIQPPSYEEATSPQATQSTQFVHNNVSSSTSDRTVSAQGPSPMLTSSSDESFQQCNIQISSFSNSNSSAISDRQILAGRSADTSLQVPSPSSNTLSTQPKDEFISPVSTSGLNIKQNEHQTISSTRSVDAESRVLSSVERSEQNDLSNTCDTCDIESSRFYDKRGIQEHHALTDDVNTSASGSNSSVLQHPHDIDPHRALGKFATRKRRHGEQSSDSHTYSNSKPTPLDQNVQRQKIQSSQNNAPFVDTSHHHVASRYIGENEFVSTDNTDGRNNYDGAVAEAHAVDNQITSQQSSAVEDGTDESGDSRLLFLTLKPSSDPQDDTDVYV